MTKEQKKATVRALGKRVTIKETATEGWITAIDVNGLLLVRFWSDGQLHHEWLHPREVSIQAGPGDAFLQKMEAES